MGLPDQLVSVVAWLEIALAPTLIGLVAGGICLLALRTPLSLAIGSILAISGLVAGIAFAEKMRIQVGTTAFISRIRAHPELTRASSMTLSDLNALPTNARADALRTCCGSPVWVETMNQLFPFATAEKLYAAADAVWDGLTETAWREAFSHHPKIGDVDALREKFASTATWAAGEQGAVREASPDTLEALKAGNDAYEQHFGYIFIVCATGKSADEMLALLQARLPHSPAEEIHVAMAEQAKITRLRLEKLLA